MLHQLRSAHTLSGFALAAQEATQKLLAFKGNPKDPYIHMGQGNVSVDPKDENFLAQLQADLEKHGKALLTIRWGEAEDAWDTLCICAGADPGGPSIVVLWFGQDAHEMVRKGSAKLRAPESNWDGRTETVAGILGVLAEDRQAN